MNKTEKLLALLDEGFKKPTPAEIAAVLKAEIPEYPSTIKTATYLLRHYAENTADDGYSAHSAGKDELPTFRDFYIDQIGGAQYWSEMYYHPSLAPNQKWMISTINTKAAEYMHKVEAVLDKWKKKGTVPKWFKDDAYDHWEKWA